MVFGRPSAQAESGFVSVLPFCAPRLRTDAEAASRAVASAPECRRRNADAETPMPKCRPFGTDGVCFGCHSFFRSK